MVLYNRELSKQKQFQELVTNLTGIPSINRDWIIQLSSNCKDIVITWDNNGETINNIDYLYNINMTFDEKTIKIDRYFICKCPSPYCHNCINSQANTNNNIQKLICIATISKNDIHYNIYMLSMSEWVKKVLDLYSILFINYEELIGIIY